MHRVNGFLVLAAAAKAFCSVFVSKVLRFVASPKAANTRMKAVEQPDPEIS